MEHMLPIFPHSRKTFGSLWARRGLRQYRHGPASQLENHMSTVLVWKKNNAEKLLPFVQRAFNLGETSRVVTRESAAPSLNTNKRRHVLVNLHDDSAVALEGGVIVEDFTILRAVVGILRRLADLSSQIQGVS
jgi:hypothetical protein